MQLYQKLSVYRPDMQSSQELPSNSRPIFVECLDGSWSMEEINVGFPNALILKIIEEPGMGAGEINRYLKEVGEKRRSAFGGNFGWCCDSRLRGIMPYPLRIHDVNHTMA